MMYSTVVEVENSLYIHLVTASKYFIKIFIFVSDPTKFHVHNVK